MSMAPQCLVLRRDGDHPVDAGWSESESDDEDNGRATNRILSEDEQHAKVSSEHKEVKVMQQTTPRLRQTVLGPDVPAHFNRRLQGIRDELLWSERCWRGCGPELASRQQKSRGYSACWQLQNTRACCRWVRCRDLSTSCCSVPNRTAGTVCRTSMAS